MTKLPKQLFKQQGKLYQMMMMKKILVAIIRLLEAVVVQKVAAAEVQVQLKIKNPPPNKN